MSLLNTMPQWVIDPYCVQRKTLKWYRKLAELFIDICVYNSYVAWKERNSSGDTHLDFRQMLIKEIITWHSYGSISNKRGPHVHDNPLRLVENHFIRKMSQVPKKQKRKCVRCNAMGIRRETCYQCDKCDYTALCVEPCFEIYHSKVDFTSNLYDDEDTSGSSTSGSSDTSMVESESDEEFQE